MVFFFFGLSHKIGFFIEDVNSGFLSFLVTPFLLEIYLQQKWTGWSKLISGASNVEFGVVIVCGTLIHPFCLLRWSVIYS